MKEIHGRRNWPWWRSQIIQKYRNDTWIWQKTLSFGNDRYTVDKDPYDWCLRQSKRYNNHSTGDNRENPTLEAKETHDSDSEITTGFHNWESPNHYEDNSPKDREEIFASKEETRRDQEGPESDSDSVGNGCGNNSYSKPNPHEEYFVESKNLGTEEIGPVHSKRRKPMTKHVDGLKHKPPDREGMTTRKLLAQGHMNHTNTSNMKGKSHQ
ncbi:hypothetical protein O181_038587 [Austropuccinia psidii MF-1]|uniref:Uncharacterized protein n=1 Tax=Austropuccinia psidii MF-1 TaxID=1389203 RepID=A0A9Q3DF20_9BASI|nr:hypothetical protein [Austropuccinia psidii MF-1]